ncbi:hypothetical protein BOX37_13490 [Nocardia mangyaensis]|uniref:Glyoxalase-like domain-containing protein n=1 Tax=Nocardia mangyaensis TaxID=2213200 RepID=A0A1J0VRW4_9NOCA|nr:VOC family protein [Nocardia mangyaensis]APE34792.1 hypothetical protein BOX37_13490 [Nocardia mangyaensis]
MTATATDFHHVGLITHDMEWTIATYERLGFSFVAVPQPRMRLETTVEPDVFGTRYRTAIFETNYLEVLPHTDPQAWGWISQGGGGYSTDNIRGRYEGMCLMHLATDDIELLRDRLTAHAVPCDDIRRYQRDIDTPVGPQLMQVLAFSFPHPGNPEGLIEFAQHLTPELVLQSRHTSHPNGARRISETIVCAGDPERYARKYDLYTGQRYGMVDPHYFLVDFGDDTRISVFSPQRIGALYPGCDTPDPGLVGFVTEVTSLAATRAHLTSHHVLFTERHGQLVVDPRDSGGNIVIFSEPLE